MSNVCSKTCPVAQALRRMFPGQHVIVGGDIRVGDTYYRHTLALDHFIDDWDLWGLAFPRRFRLLPE